MSLQAGTLPVVPRAAPALRQVPYAWIAVLAASAIIPWLGDRAGWLQTFPKAWTLPIPLWINLAIEPVIAASRELCRAFSDALVVPMMALRAVLLWAPWSAVLAIFTLLAWQAAGWRIAAFTGLSFLYVVMVGYWVQTMNTLALVGLAIPISVVLGFALGAVAARSPRVNVCVQPALDFMQTVPAFAYLIPILLLFGFGPVVGLITSIIYAIPPMVRNTILGLKRVPLELEESGRMSGCTRSQEFWWIRVPSALPQLLVGLNQTTMSAFSMVIIAAIIGGFQDIGWEVLSTMRKAQFGQSLIAGLVIALMAMVLDRITVGFADHASLHRNRHADFRRHATIVAVVLLGVGGAAVLFGSLWEWPQSWFVYPAEPLNQAVDWLTANYGNAMETLKTQVLFYFLLPLKVGLSQAVSPMTWGISFTFSGKLAYWIVLSGLAAGALLTMGWKAAVAILLTGMFLFYGATGFPWPTFAAVVVLLSARTGGFRAAAFAFAAQAFILLAGLWQAAMLSVYLCLAAVAICIVIGTLLGVAASFSDTFSAILRPVNDSLQTIPQFVLLIPILMLFRVGDFAALLAIVLYAVVPAIRYTEAGLRNVSATLVEAGRAMGCTRSQLFWQIQVSQALPEILLGINQTVMFGLAMLVIAALVGTTDLGQQIYIALGRADAGSGLAAGIGMAFIAMIADRILQGAARKRKLALGLA